MVRGDAAESRRGRRRCGRNSRLENGDNLESLLVFCGTPSDVRHTWGDGQMVVRDGQLTTVDEADIVDRLHDRIGDLSALFDLAAT